MVTSITVTMMATFALICNEAISFRNEQRAELGSLADIIGRTTTALLLSKDRSSVEKTLEAFGAKADIEAIYLFSHDRRFFVCYHPKRTAEHSLHRKTLPTSASPSDYDEIYNAVLREERSWPRGGMNYSIAIAPVFSNGSQVGTVVVYSGLDKFKGHLKLLAGVACIVILGSLLLAYKLSSRLQRIISTPILCLAETMKLVSGSKNYALRASKPCADEIGMLYDGFNEMLGEIEVRDEALRQRQEHLQQIAHFDSITGLPNRILFFDRLRQAIKLSGRADTMTAVMFIDLDGFKEVNDTFGHRTGDLLLEEVAQRLLSGFRQSDTVARLGGDEFTVLIQDIDNVETVCHMAEKIIGIFTGNFSLEGHNIRITASIGISLFPLDGTTVDELLKNADAAMYQAKQTGKNAFQFFHSTMNIPACAAMETGVKAAGH